MRKPIFVRPISDAERATLEAGLRSPDAFVLRRSLILLASARGHRAREVALMTGRNHQTVRNTIKAFHREGVDCLKRKSCRPHTIHSKFTPGASEQLLALLNQTPRTFGKAASVWTLPLMAEVCCERGLTSERVTDEAIRLVLKRLNIKWKRAKRWLTSPDPRYGQKRGPETG